MSECLDCGVPTLTGLCADCARIAVNLMGTEQARVDLLHNGRKGRG